MSFVIAAADLVQGAAQDLAGIHASLAEAASVVAGPTTGVVPAAADEVSAAISAMFGNFGQEFQLLSAQAQAFHAQFVSLMNAGVGAYVSTEVANAQQAVANAIGGGGAAAAGATPSAGGGGLLGGVLGGLTGGSGTGGVVGGLTGGTSGVGGLLGGLTGGTSGVGGLLGGLTGGTSGVGGLLGGLTGGTSGLGGLLGGLTAGTSGLSGLPGGLTGGTSGLGGLLGGLTGGTGGLGGLLGGLTGGTSGLGGGGTGPFGGFFSNVWRELHALEQALLNDMNSLQQAVVHAIGGGAAAGAATTPLLGGLLGGSSGVGGLVGGVTGTTTSGAGGLLGGLTGGTSLVGGLLGGPGNPLTGVVNSLLPGLINIQTGGGTGPGFTGIWGPYEELVFNTADNLQSLTAGWLANPYPFLRQIVANQIGYGQIIATSLATGNLQPITAIPGDIAHNAGAVFATLTNTSITPHLEVLSLLPLSLTLDTVVGLPVVAGVDLIGAPAATAEAVASSFATISTALATGNLDGAFAGLIDAPAVIANGFLNGQTTLPVGLSLTGVPVPGNVANVEVTLSLPLDGIIHPPGFYAATVAIDLLNGTVIPPTTVNVGLGSTPFSGLAPFVVNYAPEQLALAIGAPASPPPLIDLPLLTLGTNGLTGLLGTSLGTSGLGALLESLAVGTGGLLGV